MHEIEKLYRELAPKKAKIMARIVKDDAAGEDIVQEGFLRAWKYYPAFNPERSGIETWLNAILFNALRDYQNEAKSNVGVSKDVSPEDVLGDVNLSSDPELRELVQTSIENVKNEIHREVLYLFFILGYTAKETSQIVPKMTVTNVTTIVTRFREKIR